MRFLLLAVSLCASVLAQNAPQIEAVPSNIEVGKSYALKWSGGDNSVRAVVQCDRQSANIIFQPVSLILMAGPANSLSQIQTLAGNEKIIYKIEEEELT